MTVHVRPSPPGRVVVITLRGELDVVTADEVRRPLVEAVADDHVRLVLVDLADVAFLDSSVLGLFVGAAKRCHARGAQFHLINPRGIAARAIRLSGLDVLLDEQERLRIRR